MCITIKTINFFKLIRGITYLLRLDFKICEVLEIK
jgi:hypothetical protein